jgi:hypothetical protein
VQHQFGPALIVAANRVKRAPHLTEGDADYGLAVLVDVLTKLSMNHSKVLLDDGGLLVHFWHPSLDQGAPGRPYVLSSCPMGRLGQGWSPGVLAWLTEPENPSTYRHYETETCHAENEARQSPDLVEGFRFYLAGPDARSEINTPGEEKSEACPESQTYNNSLDTTQADLLAQERVAHWTKWVGVLGVIGLFALAGLDDGKAVALTHGEYESEFVMLNDSEA